MASTNRTLLKRLAVDLAALCSDPEDLEHTFDLLNATYATEVAQAAALWQLSEALITEAAASRPVVA